MALPNHSLHLTRLAGGELEGALPARMRENEARCPSRRAAELDLVRWRVEDQARP
jgi:hypothetical protein